MRIAIPSHRWRLGQSTADGAKDANSKSKLMSSDKEDSLPRDGSARAALAASTGSTDGTRSHTGGKADPGRRQGVMASRAETDEANGPPSPFAGKAGRCGNQAQQGLPPARQLCFDSGASMPWSRMRSEPILRVSPSVTDATPEMPAPAAPAATRSREKKAVARTIEENLRTGTAPQTVARIGKGSAPLGRPSRGKLRALEARRAWTVPGRTTSFPAPRATGNGIRAHPV